MDAVYLKILNMSITASWLILAVILLRVALKKAPKWLSCILWAVVAFRLICPISFESVFSLLPSTETFPQRAISDPSFDISSGITIIDHTVNEYLGDHYFEGASTPANNGSHLMTILGIGWLSVIAIMLLYVCISYWKLHRKVKASLLLRGNIWICDEIKTPFVFGIVMPRIYLPSDMSVELQLYVVAHEKAHLKRHDHWWKPLGFIILTVYWFNPLCWLAYVLLCRDIELACDERVIKELNIEDRKAYSQALLSCSIPRRIIEACPLAFGEVGINERVKNVLKYKKPAFWLIIVAVITYIVVAVCFLTNPKVDNNTYASTSVSEGSNDQSDPAKQLSLNDVIILSKKGKELSWADFEQFSYKEAGSGLYIRIYEINPLFSLWIGGSGIDTEPLYISLRINKETGGAIDIRSEDVTTFISKHKDDLCEASTSTETLNALLSFDHYRSIDIYTSSGGTATISSVDPNIHTLQEVIIANNWERCPDDETAALDSDTAISILRNDGACMHIASDLEEVFISGGPFRHTQVYRCGKNIFEDVYRWAEYAAKNVTFSEQLVTDTAAFIDALSEYDFRWNIYIDANGSDAALKLMSDLRDYIAVYSLDYTGYRKIIGCTGGLDGAYSEGYASVMEFAYKKDPIKFVRAWSLSSTAVQSSSLDYLSFKNDTYVGDWINEERNHIDTIINAAYDYVQTMPKADTVTNYDFPDIELVYMSTEDSYVVLDDFTKGKTYTVTFTTTADAILGPIVVYVDDNATVFGLGYRK